ncbi:MAG: hypothetical protein SGJ23_03500 [Alphaproteobacteria bacterium]|nr:hypothetical protein [Alphaproteobacteria bacterium]
MRLRSELIAAAALALTCAAALAQPRANPVSGIEGAWTLETKINESIGCIIRGQATVAPARNGRHAVHIEITQTCPQSGSFWARESCDATVRAGRVAMTCTVVASESGGYRPDTFDLVHAGAGVMTGRLVDTGIWNTDVTWRRAAAALVS